jgi:hypothetical protein
MTADPPPAPLRRARWIAGFVALLAALAIAIRTTR